MHKYIDKPRLLFVDEGYDPMVMDETNYLSKMNNFIGNIEKPILKFGVEYPDISQAAYGLGRTEVIRRTIPSDILMKETFRQHKSIEERYLKNRVYGKDIKKINDGVCKFHLAMSRGFERFLVDMINSLDDEYINRKFIKPIL